MPEISTEATANITNKDIRNIIYFRQILRISLAQFTFLVEPTTIPLISATIIACRYKTSEIPKIIKISEE